MGQDLRIGLLMSGLMTLLGFLKCMDFVIQYLGFEPARLPRSMV